MTRTCDYSSEQANNFDAIRIAMALLVVWSHSFALYLGDGGRRANIPPYRGALNAAILVDNILHCQRLPDPEELRALENSLELPEERVAHLPGIYNCHEFVRVRSAPPICRHSIYDWQCGENLGLDLRCRVGSLIQSRCAITGMP